MPGPQEILIIAVVILLLFGGSKLPKLARGLGQSLVEFKKAKKEATDISKEIEEVVKK